MRDLAKEVQKLQDRLDELKRQTISSPKMDGMPRGGSQCDAMASAIIQKERQEQLLASTQRRFERAAKAAQRVVRDLPAGKRLFYAAYYIDGEKQLTACDIAGISESTGYRYMRALGDTSMLPADDR